MSEYIEIETELSEDETVIFVTTNLPLAADGRESYASPAAMEDGSPVAQMLAFIEGIEQLTLDGSEMAVTRAPDADWHIIVAEISAALKDFFL